jgi:hypothetical protein
MIASPVGATRPRELAHVAHERFASVSTPIIGRKFELSFKRRDESNVNARARRSRKSPPIAHFLRAVRFC